MGFAVMATKIPFFVSNGTKMVTGC
jgi:hypothetical protein